MPKEKGYYKNPLLSGKVFEVLLMDGGWLTKEGVAMHAGIQPQSATRALQRYVDRGLVLRRERYVMDDAATSFEYRVSEEGLREYES